MKRVWPYLAAASVALNVLVLAYLLGSRGARSNVRDTAPVLLQRIVAIGKLHTVRATFERTGTLETFQNANEGVAWIPGVEQLVNNATRNTVVMTLRGSVETGIDFTKVQLRKEGEDGMVVTLPRPEVFEPTVSAELHDLKSGAFWRDNEIELKAIESAKREFRAAAIRSGTREQATDEAKRLIGAMLSQGGVRKVRFAD